MPSIDPAEMAALQAELAALRAEVAAIKDAPAAEARRKALAEAWAADLAWRTAEARPPASRPPEDR
jgi:peptidoglycan hydrolase CwlO-like protein